MAKRIETNMAMAQQRDRLAALGKLSAGLAHELNNPAAAARRAASQLRISLDAVQSLTLKLCSIQLSSEQLDILAELRRTAGATPHLELDPIAQSDREEQLIAWLDDHAVSDSCDLAPALVTADLGTAQLDDLATKLPVAALCDALTWLSAALEADELVSAIETSVGRLSDLVTAIKDYSYIKYPPPKGGGLSLSYLRSLRRSAV